MDSLQLISNVQPLIFLPPHISIFSKKSLLLAFYKPTRAGFWIIRT